MTHKNYEITMIDSKTADLIFTAAEFKFTARFEKNTRQNWEIEKNDIKAVCCFVDYEVHPFFLLEHKTFAKLETEIMDEMDFLASNLTRGET